MGLVYVEMIMLSMDWYCLVCVEEGKDGSRVYIECRNRSVLDVVKFSTLRNTKETLANFSKIPRVSLFRVPLFLVYAWSSFGSIPTQETRSKRLDTVEAKNCRICPVMEIIKFSTLAAFKPLRDLKTNRR